MKTLCFVVVLLLPIQFVWGQYCMFPLTDTIIGVHPSDTIDVTGGINTVHERQFVLKMDTTVFGFVLPIDSFRVIGYTGLLPAMIFTCTAQSSNCTTYPYGTNRLRFCLALSHNQNILSSPNWPGYDSILVNGLAFVTVPIVGKQQLAVSIPVYYRISEWYCNPIAVDSRAAHGFVLSPNPASEFVKVEWHGDRSGPCTLLVTDVLGRRCATAQLDGLASGHQVHLLDIRRWDAGTYAISLIVGERRFTGRFIKVVH